MEDIRIVINRSSRLIKSISKRILGNDGENLQENLVFSFEDEFVNGQARLEYQLPNDTTGWLALTEGEETYQIPVRNVLMSEGTIYFQLVVTEGTDETSIPLFKSNIFKMKINESLNTVEIEAPDGYASWLDLANTKLNQMDNFDINVSKVGDTATIEVTNRLGETSSASIKDGEIGPTGPQGIQGVPGYTPVKGVDYYTESEKQEMINYIINDSESEFNQNAAQKTIEFNNNADSKTLGFNQNATNKTNDFNTNATNKTTTFDNNASAKTTSFNENATSKTIDFNSNASTKTTDFDSHVNSKTTDFDTHASGKLTEYNSNHTSKLQEYDDNAQDKIDEYDEHVQELNDEIEYLKDEVNDLSDNQLIAEEEGTEIYVTDSAKARLNEFEMTKESSQKTTQGYNIFPYAPAETKTQNGITVTSDGKGTYTINGTATDIFHITFDITEEVTIPTSISQGGNGKMYLFNNFINSNSSLNFCFNNVQVDYWSFSSINKTNSTYSSLGNKKCNQIDIYVKKDEILSNAKFSVMFTNDGDTTHDFEPYTGGEASPSSDYPQEVEVVEGYDNLFDKDNLISNAAINNGEIVTSNIYDIYVINVEINKKYTISKTSYSSGVLGYAPTFPEIGDILSNRESLSNISNLITTAQDNYLCIMINKNDNKNTIQVVEGTSEHPYVPHGNNYVDVKVMRKNKFKSELEIGGIAEFDGTDVIAPAINRIRTKEYILISDKTHTLSWTPSNYVMYGYCYDSSKKFLGITTGWNNTPFTFTPITNTSFIRFVWKKSDNSALTINDISNIQLEQGSVATSYEPYQESIVPIPLNDNFIGGKGNNLDELIVDKFGKCYLLKKFFKYIITGNEIWQIHGSIPSWFYCDSLITGYVKNYLSNFILCNYFRQTQYNDVVTLEHGQFCYGNPTGSTVKRIVFKDTNYTTLNDFVSWLQTLYSNGNPVLLYYLLETPQLIDLNYTIDLKTFKGVSNITNSENANMKIRYVQDINSVISEMKNAILEIGGE